MPGVIDALAVEARKAYAARAVRGSVAALAGGTALLSLAFALAIRSGDARIAAKVGVAVAAPGWPGLLAGATQVAAAGSILALGVGIGLGLGLPSAEDLAALGRLLVLVALSGLLALPCAWAATAGRGLLAGIGLAVGLLAGTQVLVVAGAASWFPTAAPALWAQDPASVASAALLGAVLVGLLGAAGCASAWSRLELDR